MYRTLPELGQLPADYDVPKHRWSAFHGTHLDTSLRSRGVDGIVVVGGSTHVGVASTVYTARDLDYQVVVVRDGLTGLRPQREFFVEHVFPRVCRVRSADQTLAMLDGRSS
jgi:nicotinamidase-related amidase